MSNHILVVEDEQHIGFGIKYNLEAEKFRVTLVEDGPTALKLVNNNPKSFNLIILDLMLPGMSGYTVCETIRDAGMTIPILMLSARTLTEDRTRGFDVGANQYMSKPFELDELISRVKNLLQAAAKQESPIAVANLDSGIKNIEFGHTAVNFETHEVTIKGESIRMTPKELNLLKYFVENPDRVISRRELLNEVWGVSGNLQTRSVDQHIARLRKYIEPDQREPIHLLTVRDAGYRFVKDAIDAGEDNEALGDSASET